MQDDERAESARGAVVSRDVYRDTLQACPDVPADHRAFGLFMAWKIREIKSERGNTQCVVRGHTPARLAREFGVGETKAKELLAAMVRNGWLRRQQRSAYVLTVPPVETDPELMIERGYEWTSAVRMVTPWSKKPVSAKRAAKNQRSRESGYVGTSDLDTSARPTSNVGTSDRDTSARPTGDTSARPTGYVGTSDPTRRPSPYSPTPEARPFPNPHPPAVAAASGGDRGGPPPDARPAAQRDVADLVVGEPGDHHRTSANGSVAEEVRQPEDARARAQQLAALPPWRRNAETLRSDDELWRDVAVGIPLQSAAEYDRYDEMRRAAQSRTAPF